MSYVFVSHASEDKLPRVRPLVEALALSGVKLWLDRPGHGDSHFNFDREFIERHGIESLRAGQPYDEQILEAHRHAGAVLGCLSRALTASRQVLVDELVLARSSDKLVACVVDDLPFDEFPKDLGLLDASKLQAHRMDATLMRGVVAHLSGSQPALSDAVKSQWEILKSLVSDLNRMTGGPAPSPEQLAAVRAAVAAFPIWPAVRADEIPLNVIESFVMKFADSGRARRHLDAAMQLRSECNSEGFERRQIVVTPGEVITPDTNPAEMYWADVLTLAGSKSRRTLAALLLRPGAPDPSNMSSALADEYNRFLHTLKNPSS